MKIYFIASNDVPKGIKLKYKTIISFLENQGFTVLQTLFRSEDKLIPNLFETVHKDVIETIRKSDIVIADISSPSGGVGYQIYHAFYQKKPLIIIYTENSSTNPSVIIRGIKSKRVFIYKYKGVDELQKVLLKSIKQAEKNLKIRFNLVINNKNYDYLEKESQRLKMSITSVINKIISDKKNGI